MRETLRWIGYVIFATLAIIAMVFVAYRIRGPSRAQRAALALMQQDWRPKHGTNAFPLIWYAGYDVPEDEIERRYADEVASVRAAQVDPVVRHVPAAAKLAEAGADSRALCDRGGAGCLAKARANADAMRAALATFPAIRGRARAFEAADYYWNDFPVDSDALLTATPTLVQRVWLSGYALDYAAGNRAVALAGACANLGAWRRMHRGTNSLIGSMVAISYADSAMRLFADMLAALPANEPAPESCAEALKPIEAADVDRCAEMAGEFAFLQRGLSIEARRAHDPTVSWSERAGTWLMFNLPQARGWLAEQDARYCEQPPKTLLADTPRPASTLRRTEQLECISSVLACMLSDIAAPALDNYDERTLDYAAHLRLAAALLWLRETPGATPLGQRFEVRPDTLRSPGHDSGYDASRRVLFVNNMHGSPEEPFRLVVAVPDARADGGR
jgi:hypothetical protein